jgi:hypothetical protein
MPFAHLTFSYVNIITYLERAFYATTLFFVCRFLQPSTFQKNAFVPGETVFGMKALHIALCV